MNLLQDGQMPRIDNTGSFEKKSWFGLKTSYATGAGRLQWGEGLEKQTALKENNAVLTRNSCMPDN
jgi:hypothetical protein